MTLQDSVQEEDPVVVAAAMVVEDLTLISGVASKD